MKRFAMLFVLCLSGCSCEYRMQSNVDGFMLGDEVEHKQTGEKGILIRWGKVEDNDTTRTDERDPVVSFKTKNPGRYDEGTHEEHIPLVLLKKTVEAEHNLKF